ncbi:hypothetical protein J18TS1_12630 [Oceanobacillus oncorhynchi subsp. incaldanensis]|uniref:phage tail tape measure protein n=1 Tax=Oceanobacillus oncorhynchi TaxID=545501 RepID=UPI001B21FF14|nr:phage tail tape measure protein [Oceanobacillus oncorhynchi]GIO18163.1 hypothetical protein J18TS1_12630 [Oceanobacillus oncorhynchi subsp. incaldanensis]
MAETYSVDAILSADNTGMIRAFEQAATASRDLNTALRNVDTDAVNQAARDMEAAGKNIEDVGRKGQKVGGAMTKAITLPILGVGLAAVKTGADFEQSMSQVEAISGASAEEMEKLEAVAREMGAATKFSASEAADGLNYMALAGWDVDEMVSALPGVLNLASAGAMDLGSASDIVTDNMSAFNIEASRAGEVADILAYAQSNANTSVDQLGEAFTRAAPAAAAAGIDLETTTAILSAFADQGLKGSAAGTAFDAVLRDLTASAEDGSIAIGDTSVAVYDAEGNMRDLKDIMSDVEDATSGMSDEQKNSALSSIWQQQGIRGVNMLLNQGVDELIDFDEALRNADGSAAAAASIMEDNLWGALTILGSALSELAIQIYQMVEPALRAIVAGVTAVVVWMQNIPGPVKAAIGVFAALVAAIGPIILVLSTLVVWYGLFLQYKALIIAQGGILAGVLRGLSIAFAALTGPVGIAIAAVVAASVAIIALWNNNEAFRDFVLNAWDAIQNAISVAIDYIVSAFESLVSWISDLNISFSDLLDTALMLAPVVMALFGPIGMVAAALTVLFTQTNIVTDMIKVFKGEMEFSEAIDNMLEMVMQWVGNLQEMAMWALETGSQLILNLIQGLQENLPMWINTALELIQNFVASFQENAPIIMQQGLEFIRSLIEGIVTAIPQIAQVAVQIIEMYVQNLVTMLPLVGETGLQILVALVDGIIQVLPMLITAAVGIISTLIQALIGLLPQLIGIAVQIVTTLVDGITTILPILLFVAIQIITTLIQGITQALPQIINAGIQILMALVDGINQLLPVLIQTAVTLIIGLVETLIANLPQIIQAGIQILMALLEGILQLLPALFIAGAEIIITLGQGIIDLLPMLIQAAAQIILALVFGILQNLPQILMAAVQIIWELIKGIGQLIPAIFEAGMHIVSGLLEGLLSGMEAIGNAAIDLGKSILDGITGFLGINSPSRVMMEVGGHTVAGLSQGIDESSHMAVSSMESVGASIQGEADAIIGNTESTFSQFSPVVGTSLDNANASADTGMSALNYLMDNGFHTAYQSAETNMTSMDTAVSTGFGDMTSTASSGMGDMSDVVGTSFSDMNIDADSSLSDMSGLMDTNFSDMSTTASTGMDDISDSLSSGFDTSVTDATSSMDEMSSVVTSGMDDISSAATSGMDDFTSAVTDGADSSSSALTAGMREMASQTSNGMSQIVSYSTQGFNQFQSAASNGMNRVNSVTSSGMRTMLNTVRSYISPMRSAGLALATGMANGISSGSNRVVAQARNMANRAASAARKALDINSPSRVFADIGEFVAQGLADGIGSNAYEAIAATVGMADDIQDAFNPSLEMSDIDVSRQIRSAHERNNNDWNSHLSNELNVSKQPAHINFTLGDKTYSAFVDDITDEQQIKKVGLKPRRMR